MNVKKYYTWEEYYPNRFRRWDSESNNWVVMNIHVCCLSHPRPNRTIVQGVTFKEAKDTLKLAMDTLR